VTTSTVAALLTILGYSLYDTIIIFDRIRENVPRMPRAAFSQIVNRSLSEVLTRSLATSFSTLLPILALLFFGGATLKDFAFALMVGVASGAYSSLFIASPVLTHWKEREEVYVRRRARIAREFGGLVPAYAMATAGAPADVAPVERRPRRQTTGFGGGPPEEISQEEFDELVRDLDVEQQPAARPVRRGGGASTSTVRRAPGASGGGPAGARPDSASGGERAEPPAARPGEHAGEGGQRPKQQKPKRPRNRRHGRAR
jgi:SecD/SecF fusion protein